MRERIERYARGLEGLSLEPYYASIMICLRRAFFEKRANLFNSLLAFRKNRCEQMPNMGHLIPNFQRHIHTCFASPFGNPNGVVK